MLGGFLWSTGTGLPLFNICVAADMTHFLSVAALIRYHEYVFMPNIIREWPFDIYGGRGGQKITRKGNFFPTFRRSKIFF